MAVRVGHYGGVFASRKAASDRAMQLLANGFRDVHVEVEGALFWAHGGARESNRTRRARRVLKRSGNGEGQGR